MTELVVSFLAIASSYVAYKLYKINNLLQDIPGPKPNYIAGNTEFFTQFPRVHNLMKEWANQHGKVF